MKKLIMGLCISLVVLVTGGVIASSSGPSVTADEALQKLIDGNKEYVDNKFNIADRSDAKARAALAKSQKPYAIIPVSYTHLTLPTIYSV